MDPLLDFAPCGFLSVADDGSVELVNATLATMLATPADAIVGRHVDQLFKPPSRIYYQTHVFPILKLQGRVEEVYVSLNGAGNQEVPVLLNARRLLRGDHFVSDWVVVPMRQRNEYETALLKSRNIAEDALRAKDEFLAVVSHELRAPLSAISGWANVLNGGDLDDVAVRRAAQVIERNARQQSKLIDDILDLARIASGKLRLELQPVELPPLILATNESVAATASAKSIDLHTQISGPHGVVLGDADRLHQVFWNILRNAIKFTPSGGAITIRQCLQDESIEVSVTDTGSGIKPEFLPFVFERFRQAHSGASRSGGLGLGMSIASHIVELHGGTIRAASEGEGKGATFTVRLPMAKPGAVGVDA